MTDLERPGAGDLEPVRARSTACHCGRIVEPRSPDPWEGRMDDYCHDCASNRCDCYPDECPVKYPQGSSAVTPPCPRPTGIACEVEPCWCRAETAAQDREFDVQRFLTRLVGSASVAASRETRWRKRRRLEKLTQDLAVIATTYSEESRGYGRNR